MIKALFHLGIVLVLAGCAAPIPPPERPQVMDKARSLRVGMTEAEVLAIMGTPAMQMSAVYGLTLGWGGSDGAVAVTLQNGKVVTVPQLPR